MAVAVQPSQASTSTPDEGKLVSTWRDRINRSKEHRRQLEPIWLTNLAFAAGQHWQVWDERQRKLRHIAEVDPRYADRELYTADKINEHVQAQLGELATDDDRPELLLAQEGDTAEEIQKELNECAAHGWEYEWDADSALTQTRRLCLKLGVSAIRVRFDPTRGPVTTHVPVHPQSGQPILDQASLDHLEQHGALPDGQLPSFKPVHEGRTLWEPLSAFNLLTPPGVNHEDMFPWEIVVRPVLIDHLVEEYGEAAHGLTEDTDIASITGLSTSQITRAASGFGGDRGRLRDHVWLFTCYERPCRSYPDGQVIHLASNQYRLLRVDEELPYETVTGEHRPGIHYFHWWRRDDIFHSRSFIEPMKDPQRLINRRETQNAEIIDRGMPKVFVQEGAMVQNPAGLPLEVVEMEDTSKEPHFFGGIGPGQWMYEDLNHHADNLSHASTLSALRLGVNPPNVHTYSQLALLNENESSKRSMILQEHNQSKARALEDSMFNVRRYWPEQKQILVTGDEGAMTRKIFEKSKIPDFYVVRPAKGSARPRSQGAELTKVDAIWAAAHASGVTAGPNAAKWVEWYTRSLDAGQAVDLPTEDQNPQLELAHFENFLMVEQGEVPEPADHDMQPIHIPIHREALDQARASQDDATAQRISQHIHDSIQKAVTARKAWRFQDPADTNDMASDLALDEDQALRENEMMLAGEPINPEALEEALEKLKQGINPENGQPINVAAMGDPAAMQEQLQEMLQRAALKPTLIENLQVHMDRHGKVIKSEAFKSFPEDARHRFFTHFDQTRELWFSILQMPDKVESPRVSLQLRESVGASTIASVLRRAGVVDADAGLLATEPPMENMVRADVFEPDPQAPPEQQQLQEKERLLQPPQKSAENQRLSVPGVKPAPKPEQGAGK